jgi:predicted phage terminase large subunit-like protein
MDKKIMKKAVVQPPSDAPIIRPSPVQEAFLSSPADIAVFGGAAGGGKSYALLIEPLRHLFGAHANPNFGCVIFRRNATQVRNEGGLWHESQKLYGPLGASPREMNLEWNFPCKGRVRFAHLEYQKSVYEWQGSQIPLIGFDELTHFEEEQFFYMLSRNRSTCGVPAYVRATTNPDADSWVRTFLGWWIDEQTGFPIPERAGKLRWFVRVDNHMIWADSPEELKSTYPLLVPKSVTFIPAKLQDNEILMKLDPGYLANLMAQGRVERERLLDGNWNTRLTAGMYFNRGQFQIVEALNTGIVRTVRAWDRAATVPSEINKDPDWTVGLKLCKLGTGPWAVMDVVRMRGTPFEIENLIKNVATQDGPNVAIIGSEDPGSAGKSEAQHFTQMLGGFQVKTVRAHKDKETRAKPVSAQAQAKNIILLRGAWNDQFLKELEGFPDASHDDCVDALSMAFEELTTQRSILDVL